MSLPFAMRLPSKSVAKHAFVAMAQRVKGTLMPLYTAITQDGAISDEDKAKIADEITQVHCLIMNVPKHLVRVIFLSYPKESGYAGGVEAATAALIVCCVPATQPKRKPTFFGFFGRRFKISRGLPRISSLFRFTRSHPLTRWRWGQLCEPSAANSQLLGAC
jgi:phenylpyruvate tautomerase PptA (4-oxalocrotonate tautomerase family)